MTAPCVDDELLADLARSGMPREAAERVAADLRAADGEMRADTCPVRPDCWDIVMAWRVIATQWRVAALGGMGGGGVWLGLDYAGTAAGLAGMEIPASPDLWWGLRVMEAAAKEELNR